MIAYSAEATRLSHLVNPPRPPLVAEPSPFLPPIRLTLAQFIEHEIRESRLVPTERTADGRGVVRWGIRYVALACACRHGDNPGWVLVRDDPHAIAHYQRLFGHGPDAGPTPPLLAPPGPPPSEDA